MSAKWNNAACETWLCVDYWCIYCIFSVARHIWHTKLNVLKNPFNCIPLWETLFWSYACLKHSSTINDVVFMLRGAFISGGINAHWELIKEFSRGCPHRIENISLDWKRICVSYRLTNRMHITAHIAHTFNWTGPQEMPIMFWYPISSMFGGSHETAYLSGAHNCLENFFYKSAKVALFSLPSFVKLCRLRILKVCFRENKCKTILRSSQCNVQL